MGDADSDPVKSADRVLDVLELLARAKHPVAHNEIAEALAIPKSSLSKLLRNLTHREYVIFWPVQKGYSLGPRLAALLQEANADLDLVGIAMPQLSQITAATKESAGLNQLREDVVEVVATTLGPQRLSTQMLLGDVAPLYATSGGKAILAFMPEPWRREYLERIDFVRVTPHTLKTASALAKQIKTIQATGLAYSFDEYTPGITGIAKPILSASGLALASLNVAIPSARYDQDLRHRAEEALRRAVTRMERELRSG